MKPRPLPFAISRDPLPFALGEKRDLEGAENRRFELWGEREVKLLLKDTLRTSKIQSTKFRLVSRKKPDPSGGASHVAKCQILLRVSKDLSYEAIGASQDSSIKMAKAIALAEALERLSFYLHASLSPSRHEKLVGPGRISSPPASPRELRSTNGVAFHTSPVAVLKNAFCELLERDAFLTNWYSDRPLPAREITHSNPRFRDRQKFEKLGWNLTEHYWRHDLVPANCVMYSLVRQDIRPHQWNLFLGWGTSPSYKEASQKAFEELSRIFLDLRDLAISTSGSIKAKHLREVESRLVVYQRPRYIKRFLSRLRFENKKSAVSSRPMTDRAFIAHCLKNLPDVKINPLPVLSGLQNKIFCVRVSSRGLQDLDWDIPPHYNFSRIKKRYRTKPKNLTRLPHPLS